MLSNDWRQKHKRAGLGRTALTKVLTEYAAPTKAFKD
jgi:hypothetical protein